MGDLNYIDRTGEVKIAGQDATGNGVNYVSADSSGNMLVKPPFSGPVTPGTVASASALIGGQYNSSLPTLTTGQQSAIQVDSNGRLIIRPLTSADVVSAAQSGTWTTGRTWTLASGTDSVSAIQGTSPWVVSGTITSNQGTSPWVTNVSQFGGSNIVTGTGTSGSGIPRVTVSNDSNILATQSGTWNIGTVTTLTSITNPVAVTQSTSPWVTKDQSDGPVTPGAVASFSQLIGGQYNSTLPTLTTSQQSAIQLDSSGRIIIAPTTQGALAEDHNYGTIGANTLRTASQIGNATGAADFNAGATGAQTLRTVANQGASNTAANAWYERITDGTNGPVAVKPASTSPVATDPALVVTISPNTTALNISTLPPTGSKFSFGQVTHSSSTQVAVQSTAYTEPTSNSAMTIVSSSANDSSAGTGARTVTVTYMDQTGAGPFTTTFAMNGTTAVTAGVSNMCFVEKIVVATIGSTLSNVGTLTLKTGGAVTVGTIAATTNQTFWAHHYTPTGKTSYISGLAIGNNASSSGAGDTVVLKMSTPTVANTPEIQISDFVNVAGGVSTIERIYNSEIQVLGPARIRAYTTPLATSNYTTYASFDFIDN